MDSARRDRVEHDDDCHHHPPDARKFDSAAYDLINLVARANHDAVELAVRDYRRERVEPAEETFGGRVRQQYRRIANQHFVERVAINVLEPREQEVHGQERPERR